MDTQLVIRAQGGDEAAFADLTIAVGGQLHRVAYGILRDRGLAEDATQQGFAQIWRKLPQLKEPARFEAWAYRLVVHACYAEARRAKRWLPNLLAGRELEAPDDMAVVDDRDQLERGFRRLSVDQRAVIVLHDYLGMPLSEVASALGIPAGTARSRHDRAMAKLRQALGANEIPDPYVLEVVIDRRRLIANHDHIGASWRSCCRRSRSLGTWTSTPWASPHGGHAELS